MLIKSFLNTRSNLSLVSINLLEKMSYFIDSCEAKISFKNVRGECVSDLPHSGKLGYNKSVF